MATSYKLVAGNEKLAANDQARADIIDEAVRDNAVKLAERLATLEQQEEDERKRFPAAPAPKATKAK